MPWVLNGRERLFSERSAKGKMLSKATLHGRQTIQRPYHLLSQLQRRNIRLVKQPLPSIDGRRWTVVRCRHHKVATRAGKQSSRHPAHPACQIADWRAVPTRRNRQLSFFSSRENYSKDPGRTRGQPCCAFGKSPHPLEGGNLYFLFSLPLPPL